MDQLRLRAIQTDGALPPPPPSIAEDERTNFDRLVKYYYPGCEDFILNPGA